MIEDNKQMTDFQILAEAAFKDSRKQVIELARRTGTPVIVWRDGAIKELYFDSQGNEVAGNRHVD